VYGCQGGPTKTEAPRALLSCAALPVADRGRLLPTPQTNRHGVDSQRLPASVGALVNKITHKPAKAVYGARNRSAFGKQQAKSLGADTNFLLTCSQAMLEAYEMKLWGSISNLRSEMLEIFDQLAEAMAQAMVARWFRNTDRDTLRMALDTPVDPVARAKEQIRKLGRSEEEVEEELGEILALNPGLAHRTAAQTYQKRNLAEGKCMSCPKPLAPNSVRFCEEHLRYQRLRHKPIGSAAPGSADYLYADADQLHSRHGRQPGTQAALTMAHEKKTRALLAELGIPPESAAVSLKAAKEALLRVLPDSQSESMTQAELFRVAVIPTETTGETALNELLSVGMIRRIGQGVKGRPFRYFRAGTAEHAKRRNPSAKSKALKNQMLLDQLHGRPLPKDAKAFGVSIDTPADSEKTPK
jgi:hypothetical protein